MAVHDNYSDGELPDLSTIIFPQIEASDPEFLALRRSPRKAAAKQQRVDTTVKITLSATSDQRLRSPSKNSPTKRAPSPTLKNGKPHILLQDIPILSRNQSMTADLKSSAGRGKALQEPQRSLQATGGDLLLASFARLNVNQKTSESKTAAAKAGRPSRAGTEQQLNVAAKHSQASQKQRTNLRANRFVLSEATCDEDLADSDAQDEGEDDDTDLSGFIVDDDAEISYNESSEDVDSEEETRARRKARTHQPRRRLQRGRKNLVDSDDEVLKEDGLSTAFDRLRLGRETPEHRETKNVEVVDLISPEPVSDGVPSRNDFFKTGNTNLFDKMQSLKLSPPRDLHPSSIPSKAPAAMSTFQTEDDDHDDCTKPRYRTPPATPPRSPSKLKSPSKLLSPSKRGDVVSRSPHRQSMDAFWDLNEVNQWNDHISPNKAPIGSPRKTRLETFNDWSDDDDESFEALNKTPDSLPSPCESPSKSKSRSVSPVKAEKQRFLAEKRAKQLEKKLFNEAKERMADELLAALDKNVTSTRISKLSAGTGGVQIIWSNTLRSTAGRANWRRTVTKPTGSPVKTRCEESAAGNMVQHFANIELATKVIDRQERLINTLAHEFCHLANFMVSGVRDQPHGASFQNWARKVTTWMKSQDEVPEWQSVEVTTKHGYVIEWKYLWLCVGRDQNKAMQFLNISDEENGCGAEYGRHSKSINTETQRCGRCKGRLLQVRPKPRPSPMKKGVDSKPPFRGQRSVKTAASFLEKMVEIVELSE